MDEDVEIITGSASIPKPTSKAPRLEHDPEAAELQRRMKELQGFNNKDERVQNFLKTRVPVSYGVTDIREEGFRKLLPAPEICMSGDIEARGSNAIS